jgi:hypothetical protein
MRAPGDLDGVGKGAWKSNGHPVGAVGHEALECALVDKPGIVLKNLNWPSLVSCLGTDAPAR